MTHRDEAIDEIRSRSVRDVAKMTVVNLAQSIPVFGAFAAAVLEEYVASQQADRVAAFLEVLSTDLHQLGDRMDREFVRTDEFEGLFEDVVERVRSRRSEGKRREYAAAIANATTTARPTEDERFRMIDTLDALRTSHLRLLAVIASTTSVPPQLHGTMAGGINLVLNLVLPGVPEEAYRRDWADLTQHGLAQSYPSGTMTIQGLGNLSARLTPLGQRFVAFLTPPS